MRRGAQSAAESARSRPTSSASSAERLGAGVASGVAAGSGVATGSLGDADGEAATDGPADADADGADGVGVTADEHAATVRIAATRSNRRKGRIDGDLVWIGLRNAGTTKHAPGRLRGDVRQVTRSGMDERRHRAAPDAPSGTICAWPP